MSFQLSLGIKSDPILYRYTYEWLFDLMKNAGVERLQLGSFFELYHLDNSFFVELREKAERRGIEIRSCFTAHRELGGFFSTDDRLVAVARRNYERYIQVAALLGASYCGSNPGSVPRDMLNTKAQGLHTYIDHMKQLMGLAKSVGLNGLLVEPMSCSAEPPTTSKEISHMMGALQQHHDQTDDTVPVHLCGDISHGFADETHRIVEDHVTLFRAGIPWMAEFHFKNTDEVYGSTFGFSPEERDRGIIDLDEIVRVAYEAASAWPVSDVTGYLELPGPKLGRDYSDHHLQTMLESSIQAIQSAMKAGTNPQAG